MGKHISDNSQQNNSAIDGTNKQEFMMPRQFSLIIAQEYSVHHSIVLCFYDFWCTYNERVKKLEAFHNGEYWCYKSARKLGESLENIMTYPTAFKIRRDLIEFGLMMELEIKLGDKWVKTHRLTKLGKEKLKLDQWWINKKVDKYISGKSNPQNNTNDNQNEIDLDEDYYDYMPTEFGSTN